MYVCFFLLVKSFSIVYFVAFTVAATFVVNKSISFWHIDDGIILPSLIIISPNLGNGCHVLLLSVNKVSFLI